MVDRQSFVAEVLRSGERSIRIISDATAVPANDTGTGTGIGTGKQTSNGRPVLRLDDALSAAVRRVDQRRGIRRCVVERLQLDVVQRFAAAAIVIDVVFPAAVHGTRRVRRRTGHVVPIVPVP